MSLMFISHYGIQLCKALWIWKISAFGFLSEEIFIIKHGCLFQNMSVGACQRATSNKGIISPYKILSESRNAGQSTVISCFQLHNSIMYKAISLDEAPTLWDLKGEYFCSCFWTLELSSSTCFFPRNNKKRRHFCLFIVGCLATGWLFILW